MVHTAEIHTNKVFVGLHLDKQTNSAKLVMLPKERTHCTVQGKLIEFFSRVCVGVPVMLSQSILLVMIFPQEAKSRSRSAEKKH